MYHVGEGTRPCPFPVTGNGHGRVTEAQGDQFSGRNLGMIPYWTQFVRWSFLRRLSAKLNVLSIKNIIASLKFCRLSLTDICLMKCSYMHILHGLYKETSLHSFFEKEIILAFFFRQLLQKRLVTTLQTPMKHKVRSSSGTKLTRILLKAYRATKEC